MGPRGLPVSEAVERDATTHSAESADAVERVAVPANFETQPEGVLLELVDAVTGAPVSGASVEAWSIHRDPRQPADLVGAMSDALGRVTLPHPTSATLVRASTATRYGEELVEVGERATRIEMVPSRNFTARVADQDSLPVAEVLLEVHVSARGDIYVVAEGLTGPAGQARLHVRESDLVDGTRELILNTPLQRSTPEQVIVEFDAAPVKPIELKVGASGALEVSLVDRDGRLVASDDDITLSEDRDGEDETLWRLDGGRLAIEHVDLGRRWNVLLWPERYPATSVSVVGPTRAGERVSAKLVVLEELPQLRGRVLLPDGAPLAWRNVRLRALSHGFDAGFELTVSTDDEGRFEAHTRWPLPLELDCTIELWPTMTPELVALTRFPQAVVTDAAVRKTVFDLGDLQLVERELPTLCAGIVLDSSGAPVPGARVRLRAPRTEQRDELELDDWTDASGRFEFRSEHRASELRLSASDRLQETNEPHRVQPGELDVRLVMTPLAQLRGSLLLPDRARANELELQIQKWSDDGRLIGSQKTQLRLGATDYSEAVKAPGAYSAQLLFDSHVICETPPLSLRPGDVRDAPTLDARELLHVVDLLLVDSDGHLLSDGGLEWTDGEGCRHVTPVFVDGLARVHSKAPLVDVVARVPGFRAKHFRNVSDGSEITLERAEPIEVQGPLLGVHSERFEVRIELRRTPDAQPDSTWLDPIALTLDRSGRGTVALGDAGPYRVTEVALLERATVAKTWIETPDKLLLQRDGAGKPLNIHISPDAIAQALARLR